MPQNTMKVPGFSVVVPIPIKIKIRTGLQAKWISK